jgi:CheY-like chemotaxis protein
VLVVEDEVLIRLMIAEYLREYGYRVIEARNGEEAKSILGNEDEVGVVFSDVRMPGSIDGLALARWISRNKPDIGILLTSAYVAPAEAAEAGPAARELLRKPYAPSEVLQRIRGLTGGATA